MLHNNAFGLTKHEISSARFAINEFAHTLANFSSNGHQTPSQRTLGLCQNDSANLSGDGSNAHEPAGVLRRVALFSLPIASWTRQAHSSRHGTHQQQTRLVHSVTTF